MLALKLENINKKYEKFHLKDISFELEKGYIMGFIGSNGAGKTTTLKSILNMIHVDSGEVSVFGQHFLGNEIKLKQDMGYTFGVAVFYMKRRVKQLSMVIKRFYTNWNDDTYAYYLKRFKIDEDKKVSELSEGMKVKYALTLALSHDAKLFILDEPTSGLDPVARDNLLELFQELVESGERSILFSTHITSDLEKCADYITYINNGIIIGSDTMDHFINTYKLVKGPLNKIEQIKNNLIAYKVNSFGFSGLMETALYTEYEGLTTEAPTLEDIMIYFARKEDNDEKLTV
ncbi:MAG: ABC transporter ATP-binding protein [Vallitaleaceae bacterium]|jgi:ABC-2 type transport system ATP-binding protein|nr:ABC transporter ATP-binding protein [Vallitaleaceae bacterium]